VTQPYGPPGQPQPGHGQPAGSPARPFYKKKRYIIPGALLVLGVIGGGSGQSTDGPETLTQAGAVPTVTVTRTETQTPPTTRPPTTRPPTVTPPSAAATTPPPEPTATKTTTAPPPPPPPPPAPEPAEPELTSEQENAIEKARSYLDGQAFSRTGLIEQLEFEEYSKKAATFAVDTVDPDWNEQAALKAASYLDGQSFSKSGLQDQLEFEGFTSSEAAYGVKQAY